MDTKDYANYDYISIIVKKKKVDEIINQYRIFRWEVVENVENKRYEDLVDLTFRRPHAIKNKDDLQLHQVYMEDKQNQIGKLERFKHSKSTALGLCLVFLGVLLIALGLLLYIKDISLIFGICAIVLGVIDIIISVITIPNMVKKEKTIFAKRHKELKSELKSICNKVKIWAGENERE